MPFLPAPDALDTYVKNTAGRKGRVKCTACGSWPNPRTGICKLCEKNEKKRKYLSRDASLPNVYIPPKAKDMAVTDVKRVKCAKCGSWPNKQGVCVLCQRNQELREALCRDADRPNVYQPPVAADVAASEEKRVKCARCGSWRKESGNCSHCGRYERQYKRPDPDSGSPNVWSPPTAVDIKEVDKTKKVKCSVCGSWRAIDGDCKLCRKNAAIFRRDFDEQGPTYDPVSPGVYVPPAAVDMAVADAGKAPRKKCERCGSWKKDGRCALCEKRDRILRSQRRDEHMYYQPPKMMDMRDVDALRR